MQDVIMMTTDSASVYKKYADISIDANIRNKSPESQQTRLILSAISLVELGAELQALGVIDPTLTIG